MKIIQVNAWLGNLTYPLKKFIEDEDPDFVCLQEILSSSTYNPLFDSLSVFQTLKEGWAHIFFAPTYSFDALGAKIEFGNAILSKYPLTEQQTIFINGQFKQDQTVSAFTRNIRNLQICKATVEGTVLTLANHQGYHDLDPLGTEQSATCMQKVTDALAPFASSLIFCGDLNLNPDSPALQKLNALNLTNHIVGSGANTTLSSVHKAAPIDVVCDYILTSSNIQAQKFSVSEKIVSDHKALLLEFTV
jgi:endonuclease/exonuclease/phosphatase family metal-dependent hydrolase